MHVHALHVDEKNCALYFIYCILRNSSPRSRGFETIVAYAEIVAHGLLFSVLDKDKVTPESMFSGYGMQIKVSNAGIYIVSSFLH